MKIRNEQLHALQEADVRQKTQVPADGFDAVFQEQLSAGQAPGAAPATELGLRSMQPSLEGVAFPTPALGVEGSAQTGGPGVGNALEALSQQIEGVFFRF